MATAVLSKNKAKKLARQARRQTAFNAAVNLTLGSPAEGWAIASDGLSIDRLALGKLLLEQSQTLDNIADKILYQARRYPLDMNAVKAKADEIKAAREKQLEAKNDSV